MIRLTPEVTAVIKLLLFTVMCDHADAAMLNEIHFPTDRPFANDHVTRLKDLEA